MTHDSKDERETAQQIVDAAEKLRRHLGPHWPLILSVPRPLDRNFITALDLAGITVEVDRYCPPDHWYLRDGVKREPAMTAETDLSGEIADSLDEETPR